MNGYWSVIVDTVFVAIFKMGMILATLRLVGTDPEKKRKIENMSKRFGDGWQDIFEDCRTDLIKATASTTFHFSTNSYDL